MNIKDLIVSSNGHNEIVYYVRSRINRKVNILRQHRHDKRIAALRNKNDKKLAALKNKHRGQRCFIIGSGPSLQIKDLDKLKKEITIASNKIYLAFDQTEWRPTYYTISDVVVAENNRKAIVKLPFDKIVTRQAQKCLSQDYSFLYFEMADELGDEIRTFRPVFSEDIVQCMGGGYSVSFVNLQLAYYLGIREVYLIGMDFNFTVPTQIKSHDIYGRVLISEGEKNHFISNYRQKGETWTTPRLDLMKIAFQLAKEKFEAAGGRIFNASRTTKLDVFQTIDFDKLFL